MWQNHFQYRGNHCPWGTGRFDYHQGSKRAEIQTCDPHGRCAPKPGLYSGDGLLAVIGLLYGRHQGLRCRQTAESGKIRDSGINKKAVNVVGGYSLIS